MANFFTKLFKRNTINQQNSQPTAIQEILGNKITAFVLWGTILMLIVGIIFSYLALTSTADADKIKQAFAILQYVLGVLLPLWGTWIGTVLAYYYSKQNFEAANKSVQQIVDKLTPEKKLASLKSRDVMIHKADLIAQVMATGEDLSKFKLKEDCIDFLEKNKIKRVIILDNDGKAKYVIHRDLISFFIATMTLQGTPITNLTLKDMYEKGSPETKNTIDNSVKFLNFDSTLLDAKTIFDQLKSCQDIFITATGNGNEPILGWITNVTVAQNAVV